MQKSEGDFSAWNSWWILEGIWWIFVGLFLGKTIIGRRYKCNTRKRNGSANRPFWIRKSILKTSENLRKSLETSEKTLEVVHLCAVPLWLSAKSESPKPVQIRTYLHETPAKTKTNMYKFAPPRPHLWAPRRNKPTRIRTPLWKTPQQRTYWRRGVQIWVGLQPNGGQVPSAPKCSPNKFPKRIFWWCKPVHDKKTNVQIIFQVM